MTDTLTIVGKVATDPVRSTTPTGVAVTNFRLASSQRRFDSATQTWVETGTNWYSIAAFRQLAEHVKASLRTGDSVIVTGKLKIRSWESNGKQGTSVDIDAEAIGHDLRWGTSAYARLPRPVQQGARAGDEDRHGFGSPQASEQPAERPFSWDATSSDSERSAETDAAADGYLDADADAEARADELERVS